MRLGSRAQLGIDAFRSVGVHHDDRPLAGLGFPRRGLLSGAAGRGCPERLLAGRPGRLSSRNQAVVDSERIEVQVAHLVVLDPVEVGVDVDRLADADEDVLALALAGDPHVAEHALGEDPIAAPVGFEEVDALRRDRKGRRLEPLGRRGQEAVVVALGPVDDEKGGAGCQEPRREEGEDATEDDEDDASRRPAGTGLRLWRWALAGHVGHPRGDALIRLAASHIWAAQCSRCGEGPRVTGPSPCASVAVELVPH